MATWDIFHSDRLEVERNLSAERVRDGLDSGAIREDDLARPAGSGEPWTRLTDLPALAAALGAPGGAGPPDDEPIEDMDQFLVDDEGGNGADASASPLEPEVRITPAAHSDGRGGLPPMPDGTRKATTEDLDPTGFPDSYDRDLDLDLRDPRAKVALPMGQPDEYDPQAEDDEAADFTLARGGAETVEELDLAAMVDVAFQLVLFFLVTASTVVFKTLEVPKPTAEPEKKANQAASSNRKTIEDLKEDYILVDIDENGGVKVDRESADFNGLVDRLRRLKQETKRTGMLLTANSATRHKYAVKAYDAANEVGLRIGLAQPKAAPPAVVPAAAPPAPKK